MVVESSLKPLNESTGGNVYAYVTHKNGCGVVLETVE
jgi:hypothetical protein